MNYILYEMNQVVFNRRIYKYESLNFKIKIKERKKQINKKTEVNLYYI